MSSPAALPLSEVLELEQLREQCDLIWSHELLEGIAQHLTGSAAAAQQHNGSAGDRDHMLHLAAHIHQAIDSQKAATMQQLSAVNLQPATGESAAKVAQLEIHLQSVTAQLEGANHSRLRSEQQMGQMMSGATADRESTQVAARSAGGHAEWEWQVLGHLAERHARLLVDCVRGLLTKVTQLPACSLPALPACAASTAACLHSCLHSCLPACAALRCAALPA